MPHGSVLPHFPLLRFHNLYNFSEGFDCPEGTEYQACGSACPNTCSDPYAEAECTQSCHETCACTSGLLLDGNQCVDRSECGCILDNDIYISVSYLDINIRNALKIRIDTTTNTSARRVSQLKLRISKHHI